MKNPKRLRIPSTTSARWLDAAPEGTWVVWQINNLLWTKQDGMWSPRNGGAMCTAEHVARCTFTRISPKRVKRLDAAPVGVVVAWKDGKRFRKDAEGWVPTPLLVALHHESWYVAQRSFEFREPTPDTGPRAEIDRLKAENTSLRAVISLREDLIADLKVDVPSLNSKAEAWDKIAKHPMFKGCLRKEGSLVDAMIRRLDDTPQTEVSNRTKNENLKGDVSRLRVLLTGPDPELEVELEVDFPELEVELEKVLKTPLFHEGDTLKVVRAGVEWTGRVNETRYVGTGWTTSPSSRNPVPEPAPDPWDEL